MRKFVLSLFAVFCAFGISAQGQQISGTVTSEDGNPIAGVTVIVLGTTTGTATDARGNYSISAPANGTLQFSFMGMETQEVGVGGRTTINIVMRQGAEVIDEVIISAYGIVRSKNAISGAVSTISADKLISTPSVSFDEALAGKMAGVMVTNTSGLLADGTSVRIRGTNSLSLTSQPLVVLDGMPIATENNLNVFNSGNGTRFNPLATINQNDIESIEVLKDAAASALYGSRAANGVILITTKKGREGQARVSYNNYFSWSSAVNLPELLNANEFVTIMNEMAANSNFSTNIAEPYVIDGQNVDTDWKKLIFGTGFSQNHTVSVSGGTDKISAFGSADWLDQDGVTRGNELMRYSFRGNVEARPTKWLKAGVNVSYTKTKNQGVLSDGYLASATLATYLAYPNVPEKLDGDYYLTTGGLLGYGNNTVTNATAGNSIYHPTATIDLQRNQTKTDRITTVGFIEVNPVKGLAITSKIGTDNTNHLEDQYSYPSIAGLGYGYNGMVQDNIVYMRQWNWQNYANYNATFGRHTISLLAGLEYQQYDYQDIYAGAYDFVSGDFHYILDGLFSETSSGGTKEASGFSSFFGNASYNYSEKYYVDASFRRDGFSGFGQNNKYGFFPGVSAAWRISQEDFMENVRVWMPGLKLRGSWGVVGNSNINPYGSRNLYAGGLYSTLNGIRMSAIGNSDLKWEKTKKMDVGFDASFLRNNRINLSFDYWRTDVTDMIIEAPVLFTTGIPGASILTNIGEMRNSGIEIQLQTLNINTRAVTWTSTFNFTTVKNEVKKLAGDDIWIETYNGAVVGQPIGVWRLYEWAGVDPQTGRPGFIDQNSGKIKYYDGSDATWAFEDGTTAPALGNDDLVIQDGKSGTPKWYGNFDNTVTWKNFDLTVGLQFAGGNYLLNYTDGYINMPYMGNKTKNILNRWTEVGQVTDIPKLYLGRSTGISTASTKILEKANFLRLRELTLGYTLPQAIASKIGFSGRIFFRANNLFCITGYSGSDPEISTYTYRSSDSDYSAANIRVGWENLSVPNVRTYSIGLNLNF